MIKPTQHDIAPFTNQEEIAASCAIAARMKMSSARREAAVYVIQAGNLPVCKIGYSNDPLFRLGELQVSNWADLNLRAIFWFQDTALSVDTTALLAAKEMGVRLRGEWVSLEPEDAATLVLKAAKH